MSTIIKDYLALYSTPIERIELEVPIPNTLLEKELAGKITEQGFDGETLIKLLKASDGKALMTGSFILNYLTGAKDWEAGDIDIFTNDAVEFHDNLERVFGEATDRPQFDYSYEPVAPLITYIYEWKSAKSKLQLIVVNINVLEAIDNFDLEFVKSYYDGYSINFSPETYKSVLCKSTTLTHRHRDLRELERELLRYDKYTFRGFTIKLPKTVTLTAGKIPLRYKEPVVMSPTEPFVDPISWPYVSIYYTPTGRHTLTLRENVPSYDPK